MTTVTGQLTGACVRMWNKF